MSLPTTLVSKTARAADAALTTFPVGMVDMSGTGVGPFLPVHLAIGADGSPQVPALDATLQQLLAGLGTPAQPADIAGVVAKLEAVRALLAAALTVNLPAGAATSAAQATANTALASILAALGPLATDADLQATTAKVEAVRALLAGTLAISAASLPLPAGAATAAAQAAGNGLLAALVTALAGTLKTAAQANAPNVAASGAITAAGAAAGFIIPTGQMAALGVMLSGTWSGAVSFYGSMDGGQTYPGQLTARPSGGAPTQSATGNGVFFLNPGAYDHVLVVATALASGSVAVTAVQTAAQKDARVYNTALDPLYSVSGGSVGTDFSAGLTANGVAIPNVGAAFTASGPYSGYTLVKTLPALASRAYAEVDNLSTGQIVVIRDDGTAASATAPSNASIIVLNPAPAVGQPGGGGWTTTTFKGRIQIYGPAGTTPLVTAFQD
jgi:hypothetical protein